VDCGAGWVRKNYAGGQLSEDAALAGLLGIGWMNPTPTRPRSSTF